MFALVDCNTFYASCEAIFNPAVRGKPIAVLSNNDGCVISLNTEARALNIPEFGPFFQVRELLKQNQVHVFSSNYELYGDISARIMRLLKTYASDTEVYSIDEAFLRLHTNDMRAHGHAIKDVLWKQVRMPVCVGIAPTKTLAKLANRAAKKGKAFEGVCVLDSEKKRHWVLERTPVDGVWGIGKRLGAKLQQLGIENALQLSQADPKQLRRRFSVLMEKTIRELNAEPCLDLELTPSPRKEIINSRSFSYRITQVDELQQAICLYAARACEKLRRQHGLTRRLWVYAENSRKRTDFYYQHRFISLPYSTNDTRMIAHYAAKAIAEIYRPGIRFKKCGIGLMDIHTRKYEQIDFFSAHQSQTSRNLMQLMDGVNQRYGRQSIGLANAGIEPDWTMHRQFKSPAYTTQWQDIPLIRC